MAQILKQSTAVDVLIGPFVDLTDAATAETGESPSVKLSKNGQALAAKNDVTTPVHDADGYYNCELDATDTNTVGTMILTVAASATALPVRHEFQVVEEAIYDAIFAASAAAFDANQRVDVGSWLGTAVTTSATTSLPEVDAKSISDNAAAADNVQANIGNLDAAVSSLPSAATIADAVWDEAKADHTGATTFGDLATDLDSVLTDTGTTLDNHLTDIKGTGFAKDTHSLTNIEGYADLIDDGTSGLAKIATDVAAVLVDTNSLNDTKIPDTLSLANINAEVVDTLNTDTYAEPGQGAPAATATLAAKINYLYKSWRNKKDNDGSTTQLYADDGTTVDQKQSTSEAGGTVTKAEWVTGP